MAIFNPHNPIDTPVFNKHFSRPTVQRLPGSFELFFSDVAAVLTNLDLLPYILWPFLTRRKTDELYLLPPSGPSIIWWGLVSAVQLPFMLLLIVAAIIAILVYRVLAALDDIFLWNIIQGPDLQVFPANMPPEGSYNPKHRWVFLNGVAVGGEGLHQNLQVLSETFHAPVLGIHNRTYGLMGDIFECIFQRSFGFRSLDTRIAVPIIKKYLEQDKSQVERVVLVAHSQGGISASQVLDQIFAETPWDLIADGRLEVYTFGCAALFFPNPWRDATRTQRLVRHMEHYCHDRDLVCAFGALSGMKRVDQTFKGRCFVQRNTTGHLLNQHYLRGMFTGPPSTWARDNFQLGHLSPYGPGSEKDKFYVTLADNDSTAGDVVVKDASNLWKYMVEPEEQSTHRVKANGQANGTSSA